MSSTWSSYLTVGVYVCFINVKEVCVELYSGYFLAALLNSLFLEYHKFNFPY